MRILVIGINYCAESISNCFASNPDNLVFTNKEGTAANYVEYDTEDVESLKDFALSNAIELTILCDEKAISQDFTSEFEEAGLTVFAPDFDASKIALSRASAKRFLYKNKIKTPKFGIFDRTQVAIDWARAQNQPVIVNSDTNRTNSKTFMCDTFPKAKKAITAFFEEGCKQITLELATDNESKDYTYYVIIDGYNALPLMLCTHEKEMSFLTPVNRSNVSKELQKIANTVVSSLVANKTNYIGILGINFKIDTRDNILVTDFEPFFKDIDADLFSYSVTDNKSELMESAVTGVLLDKYSSIETSPYSFVTSYDNEHFYCVYGRTLNEAKQRMKEVLSVKEEECPV